MRNVPVLVGLLALSIIMGGLPLGLISWLLFGPQAGQAMFWLVGLLVGSFVPLKLVIDPIVKGTGNGLRLPEYLPPTILLVAGMAMFLFVPVLWLATAPSFFAGLLVYLVTGNIVPTLLIALAIELVSIIRTARIEKARGTVNSVFSRMTQVQGNLNMETFIITQDGVYRSNQPSDSAYLEAETPTEPVPLTIEGSRSDDDNRREVADGQ